MLRLPIRTFECLEPRAMLSGYSIAPGLSATHPILMHTAVQPVTAFHSSGAVFAQQAVLARFGMIGHTIVGRGIQGSTTHATTARLAAILRDSANPALTGRAELTTTTQPDGTKDVTFAVNVQGAAPNSMLAVTVRGVVVGTITTSESGAGELVLSSEDGTLPPNFPTSITVGIPVTVGTASGRFFVSDPIGI